MSVPKIDHALLRDQIAADLAVSFLPHLSYLGSTIHELIEASARGSLVGRVITGEEDFPPGIFPARINKWKLVGTRQLEFLLEFGSPRLKELARQEYGRRIQNPNTSL